MNPFVISHKRTTSPNRQRALAGYLVLSLLPIGLFFYVFFRFSTNIPFQDDYDALLDPVTQFATRTNPSISEFCQLLWTQDDERRIVLDRAVAVGTYSLLGTLDLRLQAFLGLLLVVGIFGLLYTVVRDGRLPAGLVLVCALGLFHIQYYETIFWAMIPLQHVAVYFFSLLSFFYLASHRPAGLILALVMAVLSVLSDVSGTFVLPAGLVLLALQHRWKPALVWLVVVGTLVLLYYHNFAVPAYRPKLSESFGYPLQITGRVLTVSGLAFDFNDILPEKLRVGIVMLVGAGLWTAVVFFGIGLLRTALTRAGVSLTRWQSVLWGGILHMSITLLALSIGRAMEGIDPLLISRYKHIGFIWFLLVFLLLVSHLSPARQRLAGRVSLAGSVLLFLFSYFQYLAPLEYYYQERNTDMYDWTHDRTLPSSPIYLSVGAGVDSITVQAVRAGVYNLPKRYFFDGPYQPQSEVFPLNVTEVGGHTLVFKNDTFQKKIGRHNGAFVLIGTEAKHQFLPTQPNRYSLRSFLTSFGENYYAGGYSAILSSKYIPVNQTSSVWVLVVNGNGKQLYRTTTRIREAGGKLQIITM